MTDEGLVRVSLLAVPLELRERSRQHGADLLREMTLLRAGAGTDVPPGQGRPVPDRLLELAAELDAVYGPYVAGGDRAMDDALDEGRESLDVTYRLPAEPTVPFLGRVRALLAEVERYCASDDYLLVLAPPPDVAAYRDWSIDQVLRQCRGEAPTAWTEWSERHGRS